MTATNTAPDESHIVEVFSHVDTHRRIAGLIKQHSTNQSDIRSLALDSLDLIHARDLLELGCGFGAFSDALKGRVHPEAVLTGLDIVPAYEPHFLEACRRSGIRGQFLPSGVTRIDTFPDEAYDLILCGFALYFFPQAIPQITRILKPGGLFITITHDRGNMGELIGMTKNIMQNNGILKENRLPIEMIISRFCAENGGELLSLWFGQIRTIDYQNALIFKPEDIASLVEYFRFKSPLFLAGANYDLETVIHRIALELEKSSLSREGLRMSKNDRIFICSNPLKGGRPA